MLSETNISWTVSAWCGSPGKRLFDALVAGILLVLTFPLMAMIAVLVAVSSRGPVLFRQERAGKGGRTFELWKFRTMSHAPVTRGPLLTQSGDPRVTLVGCILRRSKLDELPQLFNVLRGDMTLVGPRPDLPRFLQELAPEHRTLLSLRPGLTGWATLHFRDEEKLLATVPPERLVSYYVGKILPLKAQLDLQYAGRANFLTDLGVLASTVLATVHPGKTPTQVQA